MNAAIAQYNQGLALQMRGQWNAALASYDRAIAIKADFAEAYCNRGAVLNELMQFESALASHDRAIAIRPGYAGVYCNRALALKQLNRLEEALQDIDRAIALKPGWAMPHSARGAVLHWMNLSVPALAWHERALACYDRALALDPACAEAHTNRGLTLETVGRLDEAQASYDRAIALDPELAQAHENRSTLRLLTGDYARGWPEYEWRWKHGRGGLTRRGLGFVQPLWLGAEPLRGKTILLYGEQGLGDTIQFCRYASKVAALGARVILAVPAGLRSLLTGLEGVSELVTPTQEGTFCQWLAAVLVVPGETLPEFDYHCPLMSLPLAFKTTLATIPAEVPYLKVDARKALSWKEKLGQSSKLRVGLVWSGGFWSNQPEVWPVSSRRNIPLAKLLAALKHPGIEFHSLQKGEPAVSELAALKAQGCSQLIEHTQQDFSDTAALIELLDLVISVDTSVAHVAGALGKRTWVLLPFNADWRWLLDRTDSPWYPSLKLYRQAQRGDWSDALTRLGADLRLMATT